MIFNLDPHTSLVQLEALFSKFGPVLGIHQSPTNLRQKFITFYDIRHAAAARQAMALSDRLQSQAEPYQGDTNRLSPGLPAQQLHPQAVLQYQVHQHHLENDVPPPQHSSMHCIAPHMPPPLSLQPPQQYYSSASAVGLSEDLLMQQYASQQSMVKQVCPVAMGWYSCLE